MDNQYLCLSSMTQVLEAVSSYISRGCRQCGQSVFVSVIHATSVGHQSVFASVAGAASVGSQYLRQSSMPSV